MSGFPASQTFPPASFELSLAEAILVRKALRIACEGLLHDAEKCKDEEGDNLSKELLGQRRGSLLILHRLERSYGI
jgi:hypothetical protein